MVLATACGSRPTLGESGDGAGSSDGASEDESSDALDDAGDDAVDDPVDDAVDDAGDDTPPGFAVWLEPGEATAGVGEQTKLWLGAWVNLEGVAAARVVLETEGPVALPLSELETTRQFAPPIADDARVLLPMVELSGELHLATVPVRCLDNGQGRIRARLTTALPNTVHRGLQSVQSTIVCGDKSGRPDRRPGPA